MPHIYLCSVRFQATAGNTRSGRSFSSSSSSSSRQYGSGGAGGGRNNSNNSSSSYSSKDVGRGIKSPPRKHTNSTEDGELSKETVAAMRDDGIILEELFRNIPPNGAISLKSLSALISDTVKEALSERHNGLVSFIRERKHFFLLKERPEDKVFFVAANPLARQRYATREVQKRTMRDLMGLNSENEYNHGNSRSYSRGSESGYRNRGRGSYGGNNSSERGAGGGGNNYYNNNNNNSGDNYNRDNNRYSRGSNNSNNYDRERGNSYNDRRSGSERRFGNNNNNNNNERNYNRERGGAGGGGNGRDGGGYQRQSFNNGGNRDRGRS